MGRDYWIKQATSNTAIAATGQPPRTLALPRPANDIEETVLLLSIALALLFSATAFAQGLVAGLPVKLWVGRDMSLVIVPAAVAREFEERVR